MKIKRKILILFVLGMISVSLFLVPYFGHTQEFIEKTREERLVDGFLGGGSNDSPVGFQEIFRVGDMVVPHLLSRFKEELKKADNIKVSYKVLGLAQALVLFEDGGPDEAIDLILGNPQITYLEERRYKHCRHVANVIDPRCKKYVDYVKEEKDPSIPQRFFDLGFIPVVLAGQSEYLPYLQSRQDQLEIAPPNQSSHPQRNFDKASLQYEGAMDWLNRGEPEFKESPGMPDKEAIREYILEFMTTFERLTPWLILENAEKGKPVKPGHRVSYYQRDEEARPGSPESRFPINRVVRKIWETEKKLPIDLTSEEIAFNPDRTRALAFVKYRRYEKNGWFGYTFLFWKVEGEWRFRLAQGEKLTTG